MIPALQRMRQYFDVLYHRHVDKMHEARLDEERLERERVKLERLKRIERNKELNRNGQNIDEYV